MATNSQQATFGKISVNEAHGKVKEDNRCDKAVYYDDDGLPVRCSSSPSYVILRHHTGMAEMYCKQHTPDTVKEMANEVPEE